MWIRTVRWLAIYRLTHPSMHQEVAVLISLVATSVEGLAQTKATQHKSKTTCWQQVQSIWSKYAARCMDTTRGRTRVMAVYLQRANFKSKAMLEIESSSSTIRRETPWKVITWPTTYRRPSTLSGTSCRSRSCTSLKDLPTYTFWYRPSWTQ